LAAYSTAHFSPPAKCRWTKVNATEATLKVAEMGELGELEHALTPSALFALESFFGRLAKSHL
jgi:hypothetical protein